MKNLNFAHLDLYSMDNVPLECYGKSSILEIDAFERLPNPSELEALLVERNLDAIRITNVLSKNACKALTKLAIARQHDHQAVENLGVSGLPYYLATDGGALSDKYFQSTNVFAASVRKDANGASPLDAALGLFSQIHKKGIAPAALEDGRSMPAGIFRIYAADKCSEVMPHQDILAWEVNSRIAKELQGQAGWNIYIDMPTKGGELLLYDMQLEKRFYEQIASSVNSPYALGWEYPRNPIAKILPKMGEMILINSRRVHAVSKAEGLGHRVTLSGFLGMSSNGLMSWA